MNFSTNCPTTVISLGLDPDSRVYCRKNESQNIVKNRKGINVPSKRNKEERERVCV